MMGKQSIIPLSNTEKSLKKNQYLNKNLPIPSFYQEYDQFDKNWIRSYNQQPQKEQKQRMSYSKKFCNFKTKYQPQSIPIQQTSRNFLFSKLKFIVIIILLSVILCMILYSLNIPLEIKQKQNLQQLIYEQNNSEKVKIQRKQPRRLEIQQIFEHSNKKTPSEEIDQNFNFQNYQLPFVSELRRVHEDINDQQKDDIKNELTNKISFNNVQTIQYWGELVQENRNKKVSQSLTPSAQVKYPIYNYNQNQFIDFQYQCRKYIEKMLIQNGELYQIIPQIPQLVEADDIQNYMENLELKISREKYIQAISLLQLIHGVDKNMNMIFQDSPCGKKEEKMERIFKAANQQYQRWNQQYEIDRFHSKQLRFCIVVNSYNNAYNGLIYRNVDSILQQNYTNYHVIYHDDNSPDQTGPKVKAYLSKNEIRQDKFKVKINPQKVGMMENIYKAMTQSCQEGEIAVMLDGDDSFIGTNVLSLMNAVYQKEKMAVIWSQFIWISNNNKANMGYSRSYSDVQIQYGMRTSKTFVSSHLKTFFVDLFRKIKIQDLQENNGKFYGGASDTAIMLPILQMSYPKFKYLPQLLYQYRYDTGQVGNSVNAGPQKIAVQKIYSGQSYQSLHDFSFIEKAIQNTLKINSLQ